MDHAAHVHRRAVLLVAGVLLVHAGTARGVVTITFAQVGPDVVATTSGTLNLTALTYVRTDRSIAYVAPSAGALSLGSLDFNASVDVYSGISGPGSFGPGAARSASASLGDGFMLSAQAHTIAVRSGYAFTGGSLNSTTFFANQNLATFGITPGTYEWTWGSGSAADRVRLVVPGPGSGAAVLAGVFFAAGRRRRR